MSDDAARVHELAARAGEDLPSFCLNPRCGAEFRKSAGPGRRREYHSEECRRDAQQELRRARTRLDHLRRQTAHHEQLVALLDRATRADDALETKDAQRRAEDAVTRVGGMVRFLERSEDPTAIELCSLYAAVEPVVLRP